MHLFRTKRDMLTRLINSVGAADQPATSLPVHATAHLADEEPLGALL